VVKITASSHSGPFYVRLHTHFGAKASESNSKLTTLKAAYKWAEEHLGIGVQECELDMSGDSMHEIQVNINKAPAAKQVGTDKIFTESRRTR